MSFLAKVSAATAYKIYRFVDDVLPLDIDHFYNGSGVFGDGTYFSLDDRSHKNFDGSFVLFYTYEAKPKKPLLVTSDQVDGLPDALDLTVLENGFLGLKKGKTFEAFDLTKKAKRCGFDSIILTAEDEYDIEGGLQLIALKEFPLQKISITVRFKSKPQRDAVAKSLGGKFKSSTVNGTFGIKNIPISFEKQLHLALEKAAKTV